MARQTIPANYLTDAGRIVSDWDDSTWDNNTQNPKDIRTAVAGGAAVAEQTTYLFDSTQHGGDASGDDPVAGAKITLTANAADRGDFAEYQGSMGTLVNTIFIPIYVESVTGESDTAFRLNFALSNTVNLIGEGKDQVYYKWYETGWNHFIVHLNDLDVDHQAATIQSMQMRLFNDPALASVLNFTGLLFDVRARPQLIINFDDGWDGIYDIGQAIMTTAGLKATVGVYESVVGTANHTTLAELQELEGTYGWNMAIHGATAHKTLATLAAIEADVQSEIDYLNANFTSPLISYYIFPGGDVDGFSKQALINKGVTYARTTHGGIVSTAYGIAQPYYLRGKAISDNTKAGLLDDIDLAIRNGGTVIHYGHQINASGSSGDNDIDTADFQSYITGVKARVDAGLIDVVTMREWIDGLSGERLLESTGRIASP